MPRKERHPKDRMAINLFSIDNGSIDDWFAGIKKVPRPLCPRERRFSAEPAKGQRVETAGNVK